MSLGSVLVVSPSAEANAEPAVARLAPPAAQSISGTDSSRETDGQQTLKPQSVARQDEVKVQIEPPGAIAVYQFLNQDGNLVLQVPPQQMLDLAQEISKELAQEFAPPVSVQKGEEHGH
jgi:hypothetical protein